MRHQVFVRAVLIVGLAALAGCSSSSKPENSTDATSTQPDAAATQAAPVPTRPIVVDAGTVLTVTVDQTISSETNNAGDHFQASLAAPVIVDGIQVIPSGAKATGTVTVAKSAGRFAGNAELALTLKSLRLNGSEYTVRTSAFSQASKGRGKRTAIGAGAGAAAGALIGALAGGGKGAAIGAGAGAGAGTAGAALTGNRDITVPAETKVSFKLTQALEIKTTN